jgi:hypothetical protein
MKGREISYKKCGFGGRKWEILLLSFNNSKAKRDKWGLFRIHLRARNVRKMEILWFMGMFVSRKSKRVRVLKQKSC